MSKKWYEDYSDIEHKKQKEKQKKSKRQNRNIKRQYTFEE